MTFFASIIHDSRRHIDAPVNRLSVAPAKFDATYPPNNSVISANDKAAPLVTNKHSEVEPYQQPSEQMTDALPATDNALKVESKNNHPLAANKKGLAERQSVTQDPEGILSAHGQFNTEPTVGADNTVSPSTPHSPSTEPSLSSDKASLSSDHVSEKLVDDARAVSLQATRPSSVSDPNSVNQDMNYAQSESMPHLPEIEAQRSTLSSHIGPKQQVEKARPLVEQNSTTLDVNQMNSQVAKKEPVSAEYLLQKAITNLSPTLPLADNLNATAGQNRSPTVGSATKAPQVKIGQMNVIVEGPAVAQPVAFKSAVDNTSRSFLRSL